MPTVIVLAAGMGNRFLAAGGTCHKLDAMLGHKTVLRHTLDAVAATGLPMHVVHAAPELQTMGDSIAAGVAATPDAAGWLLLPADLPLVQPSTISLVAQSIAAGAEAARPTCGGQMGHPVGFAASKRASLLNCKGFGGAVQVFAESVATKMEVTDWGCVRDCDTPQALEQLRGMLADRQRLAVELA